MTRKMAELRKSSNNSTAAASAFESGPAVIPPFDEAAFRARADLVDTSIPWYPRPSRARPYEPRSFLVHGEMRAATVAPPPPEPVRQATPPQPPRPASSTASRRSSTSAATQMDSRGTSVARLAFNVAFKN